MLVLDRVTAIPPAGAGPLMTTVPVAGVPPGTELGLTLTAETDGAFTVKLVFTVFPKVAESDN